METHSYFYYNKCLRSQNIIRGGRLFIYINELRVDSLGRLRWYCSFVNTIPTAFMFSFTEFILEGGAVRIILECNGWQKLLKAASLLVILDWPIERNAQECMRLRN